MIEFILNNEEIITDRPRGLLLLDFIRYHKNLKGTKIGCREGDCGACTILVGEIRDNKLEYHSVTSCLMPIGNAIGKHIVTIEGVNLEELNIVQESMVMESGTQCGFCTPGFIMSLSGFCISREEPTIKNAIKSINGNICRCTGYKSIERATNRVLNNIQNKNCENPIKYVVENKIFPEYFKEIEKKLVELNKKLVHKNISDQTKTFIGGGTDLYVQQHDEMIDKNLQLLLHQNDLRRIEIRDDKIFIGASCTVTDLWISLEIQKHIPHLHEYLKLVSSTPIRNMATVGGNLVNASPIGDLTIFFLALNAQIILTDGKLKREVALNKFYNGYKQLDKKKDEFIESIYFNIPSTNFYFNFEKVSKRTYLDIASVNSAIQLFVENNVIQSGNISAGGVGPTPKCLVNSSAFLEGKQITEEFILKLCEKVQEEISPISDTRGTEEYKRLLLNQLVKAHFLKLFPSLSVPKILSI